MAVARVKLTKRQHTHMATLCGEAGLKQAQREFQRAHDRPGLTAELGADEVRTLFIHCRNQLNTGRPAWPLSTLGEMLEAVNAGEAREQERTRALRARLNERYPGRNG